jgi:hypothetical protein
VRANGILLLHFGWGPASPDLAESVRAFSRYSRFPVFPVNASLGYPPGLDRLRFAAVALHYTMFYGGFTPLTTPFRQYLAQDTEAFKAAFFQDEQAYLPERLAFCTEYGVNCIYTCLEHPHAERVYGQTGAAVIRTQLPGYVGDRLRTATAKYARADGERPVDVGYRGRKAPDSWGPAALEKYEIAVEFQRRTVGLDLQLDIETDESKRIYGRRWFRFIGGCKAVLGTESGAVLREHPDVPYRTVSPRHFEAAALRTCQILYEGRYSGTMEPMVHYIPLRKDFSNFDEAIERFHNDSVRRELTDNAHRDLIASDRFGYSTFIRGFDDVLLEAGLRPGDDAHAHAVAARLYPSWLNRRARRARRAILVGKDQLRFRLRPELLSENLAAEPAPSERRSE